MAGTNNESSNNTFLKSSLQWILIVFIVITLLMLLVSAIVQMLAPTFFPKEDISGFIDVIQTASILLSVLSLGFGVVSLVLSYQSGKQAEKILEGVSDLKKQHNTMEFILNNMGRTFSFESSDKKTPLPSSGPDTVTD